MALVTQEIKNLINGVSQQAAVERLPSQCERQENCHASVTEGLLRRPPTKHIAKLSATAGYEDAFIQLIDRDGIEKYAVAILDGSIEVYDLKTGLPRTVNYPDGTAYLANPAPRLGFRAVTAADFTFIVNRSFMAGMTTAVSPVRAPEAFLFVRAGDNKEQYIVTLDGAAHTVEAPRLDVDNKNAYARASSYIANNLYQCLATGGVGTSPSDHEATFTVSGGAATGFTVQLHGSLIYLKKTDNTDFTIEAADGNSGEHLRAFKGAAQKLVDLPKEGIEGPVLRILQDPSDPGTHFWVTFKKDALAAIPVTPPAGGGSGTVDTPGDGYGGVVDPGDIRVSPISGGYNL